MIFAFKKIIKMHLFFQVNEFKILHIQTLLYNSASNIFTLDAWTVNVATWTRLAKNLVIVMFCVLIGSESPTQLNKWLCICKPHESRCLLKKIIKYCSNTKLHSNFLNLSKCLLCNLIPRKQMSRIKLSIPSPHGHFIVSSKVYFQV